MGENIPFEQIQQFFQNFKGDINIINEKIDIALQMEYFEMSKTIKNDQDTSEWGQLIDLLFEPEINNFTKKKLLVQLAAIDDVGAYRSIEKYSKNADDELKHWSLLALQESRMLLQSKLLDQSQIFISTGLGGKENKLRYFFAFFTRNSEPFTDFQQNIIQKEFNYIFPKQESEIEEIHFFSEVVTVLSLVPVNIPVQDVFKSALQECNQYGDFIKENCIITNVRVMNLDEIRNFINQPE
jgi:hypothetical protein